MTVTIRRDNWGVPHVSADTEANGWFGVGYAQAEDQLLTMLRNYVLVLGAAVEAFGPEFAALDRGTRRWLHLSESRRAFGELPPQLRANLTSFMAGVEAFMAAHPERVPTWAPPLEPALSIGVQRMDLWDYAIGDALAAVINSGVTPLPEVVEELEASDWPVPRASNQWAVLPGRTAAGALAILSDPHGGIDPFLMFEFSLEAGPIRATGVTFVGHAGIFLGHTADLGWAMTTGSPKVSDCFVLARSRHEIHTVTDGAISMDYVDINGVRSPVVAIEGDHVYVVCTPYMHTSALMEVELHAWLTAPDVGAFAEAMRTCGMFAQNIMAGDRHGDAFYVHTGRTPRRPAHVDRALPIDGDEPGNLWDGLHPLDELVRCANPPAGYFQNNNIAPDAMFPGAALLPGLRAQGRPGYLFGDEPGRITSRGQRTVEVLAGNDRITTDELIELCLDDTWLGTETWLAALRTALDGVDVPAASRQVAEELLSFDGRVRHDSQAALRYLTWRDAVRLSDALSAADTLTMSELVRSGGDLPAAWQALLVASLAAAAAVGPGLTYGDLHRVGREGQTFPSGGGMLFEHGKAIELDMATVDRAQLLSPPRVMIFGPPDERGVRRAMQGGRALRFVQFTEPITSLSAVLYGQSGDPASPHYNDQSRLVGDRELKPTYFDDPEGLAANTASTLRLDSGARSEPSA